MRKEKIDVELPQSAKDFLNYCENVKGLAKGTIEGYDIDLRIFIQFLKLHRNKNNRRAINDKFMKTIKLIHLHNFMSYLKEECENQANTRAKKVATLKAYFNYLQNKAKLINYNPAYELESPKQPKRQPIYLTLEESKMLLESLEKYDKNYERDYCIIVLFLNCGMRLSELENIKMRDIKEDILTIIGKGDKERSVYLNEVCLDAIDRYMAVREDYKIKDDRLFNIGRERIEQLVKDRIIKAGINEGSKYSPHKLRHTVATLLYKHGNVGIAELKELLGHSNISTTEIYTHVDSEQIRNAVKKNPLNKV